jgi:hypothetical protein
MRPVRAIITAAATMGLLLLGPTAFAASQVEGRAAYSCTYDSYTHVLSSVDWLRVHTSPGVSTPAVGQIPGGSGFTFCSSSGRQSGGHYWVYGYGYNGSVRVTGWVAGDYLIWP